MSKPKNRAKCALWGTVVVSTHQHDFVSCKCGEIFVDGGNAYWRCGAKDMKNLLRFKNRKWVPMKFNNETPIDKPKEKFWDKVLSLWKKGN